MNEMPKNRRDDQFNDDVGDAAINAADDGDGAGGGDVDSARAYKNTASNDNGTPNVVSS